MAIKLFTRYPGRADPASTDYPQGSFKNRSAPGVLDGTPLEKDWANDITAFFQSLLKRSGRTPNDLVDTVGASQYFDALEDISNIPVWSNLVNYTVPAMVFGSDNSLYVALLPSGPGTAPQDPVSAPTYWSKFDTAAFATQAEVNAGAVTNKAVNPLTLKSGFAISLTTNGYIKLPTWLSGLIFQWGTTASIPAGTGVTVTLPLVYPNNNFCLQVTRAESAAGSTANSFFGFILSTSQIKVNNGVTNSLPGYWFSIGN